LKHHLTRCSSSLLKKRRGTTSCKPPWILWLTGLRARVILPFCLRIRKLKYRTISATSLIKVIKYGLISPKEFLSILTTPWLLLPKRSSVATQLIFIQDVDIQRISDVFTKNQIWQGMILPFTKSTFSRDLFDSSLSSG